MISNIKLSICIATFNRGKYLERTLDSILSQMQSGMELVLVDGASTDNTSDLIGRYQLQHPEIKYYRELKNSGVDRDYDKAIGYASGEYCWLMTDDDLLHPDAINTVLRKLDGMTDLVIVNAEVKDKNCKRILEKSLLKFDSDCQLSLSDGESLFVKLAQYLSFIGSVVIKRKVWLSRDREAYYGTLFVHVGVIFQDPPIESAIIIAEPLISIRYGNAMWTSRGFEIWMIKWPQLIWSFRAFSDRSKALICPREPWRLIKKLVLYRAIGAFSISEYQSLLKSRISGLSRLVPWTIALIPGWLANTVASLYIILLNKDARVTMYDISRSRHSSWLSHIAANILR
jgi:abequosyltransferase